jgi:hypothetical protein
MLIPSKLTLGSGDASERSIVVGGGELGSGRDGISVIRPSGTSKLAWPVTSGVSVIAVISQLRLEDAEWIVLPGRAVMIKMGIAAVIKIATVPSRKRCFAM